MKHIRAEIGSPEHWEDQDGFRWRRIIGGIGWPSNGLEGVGLVLAESLEPEGQVASYKVLSTVKDFNASTLLHKCKSEDLRWPVRGWYSSVDNQTMMVVLYEFQKGRNPEDKIKFFAAPLAEQKDNSGYYLPLVITIGEGARLNALAAPMVLRELEGDATWPETHLNKDIALWPALAALCYPLAYLQMYSGRVVKPIKKDYRTQYGANAWQL